MAVKKTIEIDVRTEDSVKDVEKLTTSIQKTDRQTEATKKTTDSLVASLDRMSGGAITAFKGMVSGAKNGVMAMKSLKVAIAATGIGLLLIAVTSLVTYFTKTQRGADLVSKAFAGIGATVSVLIDRVSSFGEGLALIFSGKYKEGADMLKASVKGIGEEIKNEATAAWELDEALKAVEDREIKLIQVNAKRRASIERLRLDAEDATKTEKERAAALQESIRIQNELTDDEIAIAKERARISQAQVDLGESTREELRANEEIQARVVELEAERDRRLKTVQTRLNSLIGTEKELTETIRQRQAVEGINAELNPEGINELDVFKELQDSKFQTLQQYGKMQEEFKRKQAEIEIYIEQEKNAAVLDLVGQTAGAVANVLGRNSKMGKAAGIAQALVNTYQGITEVWKTPSVLPEPAATISKIASTITVGASGFAAVKNIQGVKLPSFPGMSGGGSSGGSAPRAQAAPPPAPSFNIVGNNQANQLGEAINKQDSPLKAYVVSREMTDQQELDRNIRQTASVG